MLLAEYNFLKALLPDAKRTNVIDKQATDKMAEMLTLIRKYGTLGNTEVETEASSEYRRRAWVIAKMLSKLAEHAAESDFYYLLSDRVSDTDKDRQRCYKVARKEDHAFMVVLGDFDERAKEFAVNSAGTNEKTETQLVHEIELLTSEFSSATAQLGYAQDEAKAKASKKKIKDVLAFVAKDATVIAATAMLKSTENEFAKANAAAEKRGFVVKITKVRTLVNKLEPVKAPVESELKVMAKPTAKAKPTVAKKAA